MLQKLIHEAMGTDVCEHSPNKEYHREGLVQVATRLETPEERWFRRLKDNGIEEKVAHNLFPYNVVRDFFADEPLQVITLGKALTTQPTEVWCSEQTCDKTHTAPTALWFPENWSFGNGVTTNVWVKGPDGTLHLCSWAVVVPSFLQRVNKDKGIQRMLCEIVEMA